MRRLLIALGVAGVVLIPAHAQTPAPQRFRLALGTVQLAPGQMDAKLIVSVMATLAKEDVLPVAKGAPAPQAELRDVTPSTLGVSVVAQPVQTTADLVQTWNFPVAIQGLQRAETQSRVFLVTYGTLRETLAYSLSNTTQREFAWAVKSAAEWNLSSMTALPLAITIGNVAATNVKLLQAVLTGEDKLKRTLGTEHFQLCQAAHDPCQPPAGALAPRQPHTFYVRAARDMPVGTFKGNIFIAASEKTDPEVLAVTLYSPDPNGLRNGLIALGVGILFSLFLQVLARGWVQRRQDKIAVATLRLTVANARAEFKQLLPDVQQGASQWLVRIGQLEQDMQELDTKVRGVVPQAFPDEVAKVEDLKAALERHGKTASLLRSLLRDGLQIVDDILKKASHVVAEAKTAAETIAGILTAEGAGTKVETALTTLRTAANQPQPRGARASASGGLVDTIRTLQLQVTAANTLIWLFWALVSVLSGALLLIYSNPAFGTEIDYLTCLAWGMGVSVAGQQASQVNPGSVAQSIGIELPGVKK